MKGCGCDYPRGTVRGSERLENVSVRVGHGACWGEWGGLAAPFFFGQMGTCVAFQT
jgi:hypothetical protein